MADQAGQPNGPLGVNPELDAILAIAYAAVRTAAPPNEPPERAPITNIWLTVRSALSAARAAEAANTDEIVEALGAAIGEIIADMPGDRQQLVVQNLIHQAFVYAGHLRSPAFDTLNGRCGHA